jgi:multiple sugar transport system permease protein
VFDQVKLGTQGGPAKTTLTPAYLSYQSSFNNGKWGQGAAISFVLFGIIIVMNLIQRLVMREREPRSARQARRAAHRAGEAVAT